MSEPVSALGGVVAKGPVSITELPPFGMVTLLWPNLIDAGVAFPVFEVDPKNLAFAQLRDVAHARVAVFLQPLRDAFRWSPEW